MLYTKPSVFISYSHEDEVEKKALFTQLNVLSEDGQIDIWVDDNIGVGEDWEAEIWKAIKNADVSILLITANFLVSKFILNTEIPAFLGRKANEGLLVFPIIARYCAWKNVSWLRSMNVRPKNGDPIWRDNGIFVDEELARIVYEVDAALKSKQPGKNNLDNQENFDSLPIYENALPIENNVDEDDVDLQLIVKRLSKIISAEFEMIIFKMNASAVVPGSVAPQQTRAIELVRFASSKPNGLSKLKKALES